jgi:hypothetical protein
MPNTTTTQATTPKATLKQINYLKALATRTGTSFTYPHTRSEASAEIQRLRSIKSTGRTFAELATDPNAPAAASDPPTAGGLASDFQDFEVDGYGSTATWSRLL